MSRWSQGWLVPLGLLIAFSGCSDGGGDGATNTTPAASTTTTTARTTALFVDDGSGNLNVFKDQGQSPIPRTTTLNFGGVPLGEIHFAHGKALVNISSGLTGPAQGLPAGGLAIVNVQSLAVEKIVTLESTRTGKASRIVHSFLDPEERYLWLNNDGPSGDPADDSVFRVDIVPTSATYLSSIEIVTGNGHHKSTFSYPSAQKPNARRLFATHNLTARTISVIDNEPTSSTFLQVIKTVGPGDATTPGTDASPHGMDYSPVSGHIYTGMTAPSLWAVTIIDTTSPNLPVTAIPAGTGPGQIPAAGYMHASHDGQTVYTVGWKASADGTTGTGWLSAIDATNNDRLIAVINLGNVSPGSLDENGAKMYLPSRSQATGNPRNNVVLVVDINPSSPTYHQVLREITVGQAGSERNGDVREDGRRAYYPDTCATCVTVSVIDTQTDTVVDTPIVQGLVPGALGTVPLP